jgi:Tol biopolymer transport system component
MAKRLFLAVGALALTFGILVAGSPSLALADDSYRVRLVATPLKNITPSFATPLGDYLAWTGSYKGFAKMFVYDLVAGENVWINPGPSGSYYNPAAEGGYVVFQGSTTGGYDDIYLYDRAAQRVEIISSLGLDGDRNDWNPRIQGDRVVWEKTPPTRDRSGIYLYDMHGGHEQILAGPEYRSRHLGRLRSCTKTCRQAAPMPARSSSIT